MFDVAPAKEPLLDARRSRSQRALGLAINAHEDGVGKA